MAVVQLSAVQPTLLPPTVTEAIFNQTSERSAVQQLARRVPLAMDATTVIPVSMDVPVPGWVSEGGQKPVGAQAVGIKQMSGKKLALILPVSEELARTNAGGLYDQIQQDLPLGLSRAFDYACVHGLDLRTGGAGPFADYLKATPNSIELGTTSQANGGLYVDLVNGEEIVVDNDYDFSGFAGDPRLRPKLKKAVDLNGLPIWQSDPTAGFGGGQLIGFPAVYNRGVSGKYTRSGNRVQVITITGAPTGGSFSIFGNGNSQTGVAFNAAAATVQTAVRALGGPFVNAAVAGAAGGPYTVTLSSTVGPATAPLDVSSQLTGGTNPTVVVAQSPTQDTKLRAIGGDWTQAAWGQGMDITIKLSGEASYVDDAGVTHSAFQENLILLLIEAYYGFVVGNKRAFVAYTDLT